MCHARNNALGGKILGGNQVTESDPVNMPCSASPLLPISRTDQSHSLEGCLSQNTGSRLRRRHKEVDLRVANPDAVGGIEVGELSLLVEYVDEC